mgnify:CR=1 FL=1
MKEMMIKQEYLTFIKEGRKKLEIRVGYKNIKKIKSGDSIMMKSASETQSISVKDVRYYKSFEDMLKYEKLELIAPGSTEEETLRILKEIYPPEKEELGVIVIELEPVESFIEH